MDKPVVTIENWAVVESALHPRYQALQPGNRLTGNVFGHSKLKDMQAIFSSRIVAINLNARMVETANTAYRLGEPSDEYTRWDRDRAGAAAASVIMPSLIDSQTSGW